MKNRKLPNFLAFLLLLVPFIFAETAEAQSSAFTFQGKLADGGIPANGQYDLQFKLYDAPTGGTVLGTILRDDVVVTQGIFTVTLDYGADVFTTNSGRYLEVGVRIGTSTGAFTTINPRQELTAAPYSLQAVRATKATDAENFGGQPSSAYLRSNTSQTFTGGNLTIGAASILDVQGALFGNGANLTNLNAGNILSGTLDDNRLSLNAVLRNRSVAFSGLVSFDLPPFASGANFTNLRADNISSGTLSDARLSGNIPKLNTGNTFSGTNNNFTGQISANTLGVGGGLPITKILTASSTLDFGKAVIYQEVLNISVPGARVGDAVYLGIPANVLPIQNYVSPGGGTPVPVTQPYIFQAYVSSADTVSITWDRLLASDSFSGRSACLEGTDVYNCQPPAGVFRVVVFSFAP